MSLTYAIVGLFHWIYIMNDEVWLSILPIHPRLPDFSSLPVIYIRQHSPIGQNRSTSVLHEH